MSLSVEMLGVLCFKTLFKYHVMQRVNKITHNSQMTLEEEPVQKGEDISVEVEIPRFIEELSDQEVTEGDTVTLFVQVDGKPFPKLTW